MNKLIGQQVMNRKTKARGVITHIEGNRVTVSFFEGIVVYQYPAAFADTLILQDEDLQKEIEYIGSDANFENFRKMYSIAINSEVKYLKETGGKRYRIIDGELLQTDKNTYIYSFDTDAELYFPDGTNIKIWLPEEIVLAHVISCEEFTIIIQLTKYIGEKIESVEITAEPWQLMEALVERIEQIDVNKSSIAYELACKGRSKIDQRKTIGFGQDLALKKASMQPITFIWGPPGTGKTETLAKIALEYILKGSRVLMLSYSNVSVDGALLRVSHMADQKPGQIIRYGYPRVKELLESNTLTAYAYVLYKNPGLFKEYQRLVNEKKTLKRKDTKRVLINKQIASIRARLLEQEKELIQNAAFVATTVSKAIVDKAIYMQKFDLVIFDEASMAYIPQIIFAASLAKTAFCCLGDFRQLPAIVQRSDDKLLTKDIFEHTGITSAVERGYGHEWLVMLNYQYRMHPEIANFVSKYMYENMLRSAESIYEYKQAIANCAPMTSEPMGMIDLSSTYSVCIKTIDGSRINVLSAMICVRLAEEVVKQYGVGIITPYSAQSKLILTMIRDLQERNKMYMNVNCATVHQFQGSEKPVILYDAVDCFRMSYPGTLLTSKNNNIANRLFNVALTRTQGKFVLVANKNYFLRKNISKDLMFTKTLESMNREETCITGEEIVEQLGTLKNEMPEMFLGDRDEIDSWERYISDLENAHTEIFMDIPGVIDDDEDAVEELRNVLKRAENRGVHIYIRVAESITLPKTLKLYEHRYSYVTTPLTIVDGECIWFGEPLSSADFISEGRVIETKYFPCLRFKGKHTARMLKSIFEIPSV